MKSEQTTPTEDLRQAVLPYSSADAVQDAITKHGSRLLDELSARGFLDNRHQFLNGISADEFITPDSADSYTNGVSVYGVEYEGDPTAVIQVIRTFGDVLIRLFVKPDLSQAHLIIKGADDEILRQVGSSDRSPSVRTVTVNSPGETATPESGNVTTSSGCLSGGCCEKWVTSDNYGCAYVNFDCCVDSDGCYTCIDQGTSDCWDCGNPNCYCDCPSCE